MGSTATHLQVTRFSSTDVHVNLALEEYVFRTSSPDTVHILFYRHGPAVVFGRNQNPWTEFDVEAAVSAGLTLARRISGGGTVYHDRGNLNYSFIMPRQLYDPQRFLGMVTRALSRVGISAAACDRSSVWFAGKKVSGTAFMLTGKRAMLHGCILVDSDLGRLREVLHAPKRHIESKAVRSVRAPVTSLVRHQPGIVAEEIARELVAVAAQELGVEHVCDAESPQTDRNEVLQYLDKQRSVEWILGRTSEFRHHLRTASQEIVLTVKRGIVSKVEVERGGLDRQMLADCLVDRPYDGKLLAEAISVNGNRAGAMTHVREALGGEIPAVWARVGGREH